MASKFGLRACKIDFAHQNVVIDDNIKALSVVWIVINFVAEDTLHLSLSQYLTVFVIVLTPFQQVDLTVSENVFSNHPSIASIS